MKIGSSSVYQGNLRMTGVISILISCRPNAIGVYAAKPPMVVPLEISQMMA